MADRVIDSVEVRAGEAVVGEGGDGGVGGHFAFVFKVGFIYVVVRSR